jgi:hypothetical protein
VLYRFACEGVHGKEQEVRREMFVRATAVMPTLPLLQP